MTLREFLKSIEGVSDAVLDKPMKIMFDVYEKDGSSFRFTPEVEGCGTNKQDTFIGPLGILSEEELMAEIREGEPLEEYDLYIPKDQLILRIPDMKKLERVEADSPSPDAVPHMKIERE